MGVRPRKASRTFSTECHKRTRTGLQAALASLRSVATLVSMGFFRFRKTIPLGRFLRINVSKTGPSLSVGRPGATVNIRKDRVDGTVGIPGSGLSYKERLSGRGCAPLLVLMLLLVASLVCAL